MAQEMGPVKEQLRARSAPVVGRSRSEGVALWTVATSFTAAVSLTS
jgi:hypothetical protein